MATSWFGSVLGWFEIATNSARLARQRTRERSMRLRIESLEDRNLLAIVPTIVDINSGAADSNPGGFVSNGVATFFFARDVVHGNELWKTDGTSAGTVLVRDINPGSASSNAGAFANIGGTIFFTANDGVNGGELWKTDGTSAGTVMVLDIRSGPTGSSPFEITNVSGTAFFRASTSDTGYELWKSDGTALGTVLVEDIKLGDSNSFPSSLTNANGILYFRATDSDANGYELWRSDGTAGGTFQVADINPGPSSSGVTNITNVNGTIYFAAVTGAGRELWASDGSNGAVMVRDINPGAGYSDPALLRNFNGKLYFLADDGVHGQELWTSNGTSTGTTLVIDLKPGSSSGISAGVAELNGSVYFVGIPDLIPGLFRTDGTSAGTSLVLDQVPIALTSGANIPANVNGTLYFARQVFETGAELWMSDGTSAGSILVGDLAPGSASSSPVKITNANGVVVFEASNGTSGREFAVAVAAMNVGPINSVPGPLTVMEDTTQAIAGISVNDADAGGANVSVNLSVAHGTLVVATNVGGGVTGGQIISNNSASVTITAPLANINATLANLSGLLYTPTLDYLGTDSLVMFTSDLGNSGTGGALTDTDNVAINVVGTFAVSGSTLTINATTGNDTLLFQFFSATDFLANLNGQQQSFNTAAINTINFNGLAGNDAILFYTPTGVDTATLSPSGATVSAASYTFNSSNVEFKYLFGDASDSATFNDTAGNDQMYQLPQFSLMLDSTVSYFNEVIGFGPVISNSDTAAGIDLLFVYGTVGNDTYAVSSAASTMTGTGVSLVGNNFEQVYAFGLGGSDTATFTGGAGSDLFYGLDGYSVVVSGAMLQYMVGFAQVTATAGTGSDAAIFFDSAGNDTLTANHGSGTFVGATFNNTATGFDQLFVIASGGGVDTANLDGSNTDDLFSGNAFNAALFRTINPYLIQVYGFDQVNATLTGAGTDIAELIDGGGNDVLNASGATAEITYAAGNKIRLQAFDLVFAKDENGGTNTKNVADNLSFQLFFLGTWVNPPA